MLSSFFRIKCGIRQGGVLSPYFFAIYIDSVVDRVNRDCLFGCYIASQCLSILLFADDIIIIAPSVVALQKLLSTVENELTELDMQINAKKSSCLRIGPRSNVKCANIYTSDDHEIQWSDTIRYLGVYLTSAKTFACCFSHAKKSFYMACNSIFGKIGRIASENVVLELVRNKCMPAMLYGLDACPINNTQINSLQFAVTGMLMKLFQTRSKAIIDECSEFFNFSTVATCVNRRKEKFLCKYAVSDNILCRLFSDCAVIELNYIRTKLV